MIIGLYDHFKLSLSVTAAAALVTTSTQLSLIEVIAICICVFLVTSLRSTDRTVILEPIHIESAVLKALCKLYPSWDNIMSIEIEWEPGC
jgi:hypothetical protein